MILNIDFAPTFVDLAGGQPPSFMDGSSFKDVLLHNSIGMYKCKQMTYFSDLDRKCVIVYS